MLKNVKLLVLKDKTINLPFEKELMHRLLLFIGLGVLVLAGCKKENATVTSSTAINAQAAEDDKIIQSYLAANNLTAKFAKANKDSTGLYYMITKDTTTTTLYSSSTLVTVGYVGRVLPDDYVFIQTNTFHPSFTLSQMIRGWNTCIPFCKKGGAIRIIMASRYAYGPYAQDSLKLKPNSVLDFDINVYDVTN